MTFPNLDATFSPTILPTRSLPVKETDPISQSYEERYRLERHTKLNTWALDNGLSGILTATDERCNGPGNAVGFEDLRYNLCYGNSAERRGWRRLPDGSITCCEGKCEIPDCMISGYGVGYGTIRWTYHP